jgi:SAM-dependent methyltransferase
VKVCLACDTKFAAPEWRCPVCGSSPETNGFLRFCDTGADSYHAELFEVLERVEDENFWFRSRNRLIQWALKRYFPNTRSLVEVGCGTGYVLAGLRDAYPSIELTGVELFSEGLRIAARRVPDAALLQADARRLPFEEEFDVAAVFDVLEHIDEDMTVLQQLARVLKPGGGLLVTVPQHPWLWSSADDAAAHQRRYTRTDLERKIRDAGFELVRMTSFVSLLLPAMAAVRRPRRADDEYEFANEFRTGPQVNRALEAVMALERALIRAGASLPAGGSLLAVARKAAS